MTVCEQCWADASRDAQLLGGSVVDHYHRRIEEAGTVPDHALPTQREIHWQQRVDEIANAAHRTKEEVVNAHSIAERGAGLFVCTCGEEVPVFGTTHSSYSRALWSHTRDVVTSTSSTTEGGR